MFGLIQRINSGGLAILLVEQNVMQSLVIAHRAYVLEGSGTVALAASNAPILASDQRDVRDLEEPARFMPLAQPMNLLLGSPASENFGSGCRPHTTTGQHAIQHLLDGRNSVWHPADPRSER